MPLAAISLLALGVVSCGGAARDAYAIPPDESSSSSSSSGGSEDGAGSKASGDSASDDSASADSLKSRGLDSSEGASPIETEKKKLEADKSAEGDRGPVRTSTTAPPPPPNGPDGGSVKQASVASATTPLGGQLSQKDIGDIVMKNSSYFDPCYAIGTKGGRNFQAVVTVRATLGPSGAVVVADVIKSTAKNTEVDTCVSQGFKKIKFPSPSGGGTAVITFPLEFSAVQQVP